jgi:SAM-dependent methyltransferase
LPDLVRPTLAQVAAHLREHHGIRFFPITGAHRTWSRSFLSEPEVRKLSRYRREIGDGTMSPRQIQNFYEFIAERRISEVTHSLRADIIARSTWLAAQFVPDAGSVLDLGCHVGHGLLTLAALVPGPEYVGLDGFAPPLAEAEVRTRAENLTRVRFERVDLRKTAPSGRYDLVLDLQTTHYLSCEVETWRGLAGVLKEGGRLLSIPPVGEVNDFERLIRAMQGAGFSICGMMPLFTSDLGAPSVMPVLFAMRDGDKGLDADTLVAQFESYLDDYWSGAPMQLAYREFEYRARAWMDGMGIAA